MANEKRTEQLNARNPTTEQIRNDLIKDITEMLRAATNYGISGRYHAAVHKKESADTLIVWGSSHGYLEEQDRRLFYGNRAFKGKDEPLVDGMFPEKLEAKCRRMIEWDQVQAEVCRRMANLIDRIPDTKIREEVWGIYTKMPKET